MSGVRLRGPRRERIGLLVMRKQLDQATLIRLVYETAAARAQMAFALAVLMAEIVAAAGRIALEAVRRLAKTLGRCPVGLQLGHDQTPVVTSPGR